MPTNNIPESGDMKQSKSMPLMQMTTHALTHRIRNICIIYKYLIYGIYTTYTFTSPDQFYFKSVI